MKKKILFYNWIQFDDEKNRGGGVTIYQRNIINEFVKDDNYEVYFLSSGTHFSPRRKTYYVKTENVLGDKCHSYKIINSTVLAPSYLQFYDVKAYYTDEKMYKVLRNFIEKEGPFDTIHFNNFEGLTTNALKVKEDFPNMKIIYSIHNYFPFCPQVGLWYKDHKNCKKADFNNGEGCTNCSAWINREAKRTYGKAEYILTTLGFEPETKAQMLLTRIMRAPKILEQKIKKPERGAVQTWSSAEEYVKFRKNNVENLNKYCDCVVAVSDRVGEIAIEMGVDANKVKTIYIGTKFASEQKEGKIWSGDKLNIIYMGYPRADKGFFFLIDALSKMDDILAEKINVTFATKTDDANIINQIKSLNEKFNSSTWINGYTHDTINDILKNQDLGVVPILWEDNLPQVAIEMAANGLPVLTGDLGGAHELSDSKDFMFESGNIADFEMKIKKIAEVPNLMQKYWDGYHTLTTMEKHIEQLKEIYC